MTTQPHPAPAALPELLCRLYSTAYAHGHHDTVEGQYTDVHQSDVDTYWRDRIEETLSALALHGTPGSVASRGGESTGPVVGGAAIAEQPKAESPRLIGWRTDDYLMETADKSVALNWQVHYGILPIFEGDQETKLTQPQPSVDHAIPTDEAGMREYQVPTPESGDELASFIASVVNRDHDYGTSAYAMSLAATAAFNYVAKRLGVTGFQASCADMDVLRRTRNIKGPFLLIDGENALYPQYDLKGRLDEFLRDIQPWLAEQAEAKLKENSGAVAGVVEHWQRLSDQHREGA